MERTSHPDAKDLKLPKTTKGLWPTFKTKFWEKKSCDNKTKTGGNAMG